MSTAFRTSSAAHKWWKHASRAARIRVARSAAVNLTQCAGWGWGDWTPPVLGWYLIPEQRSIENTLLASNRITA